MKFLTITSSSRSFHFSLMHNQLTSSSAGVAESKEEFGRKENIVSTTGFKIFTTTTVKNNGTRFLLPVPVFADGERGQNDTIFFSLSKGGVYSRINERTNLPFSLRFKKYYSSISYTF